MKYLIKSAYKLMGMSGILAVTLLVGGFFVVAPSAFAETTKATTSDFFAGAITAENVGSALANGPETINTGATQSAVTNGVITVTGAIRAKNSNVGTFEGSAAGPAIAQYLLIPANSVSVEEFKIVDGSPISLGSAALNNTPGNPDAGWFDYTKGVFRMGVYLYYSGDTLRTGDLPLEFVFKDANGTVLKDINYTLRYQLDTLTHKYVSTIGQLTSALSSANDGDVIELTSNITSTSQLDINKAITLDGNDHTLTAGFSGGSDNSANSVIYITSNNVTIKNLVEDGGTTSVSATIGNRGINIYRVTGVTLDTVTAENNSKNGVVVNGSTVTVKDITTKNNGWGGIDVDKGSLASLTVNGASSHSETRGAITIDDTSNINYTVTDTNNQYSHVDTGNIRVFSLLATGQTTPDGSGNATVTDTNKDVVITSTTTPITIALDNVAGATINFDSLITDGTGIIPKTTINSTIATVEIPADTTVTAPGWDGIMSAPTPGSTSGTAPAGFSVGDSVIEMGSPLYTLNFDQAVKITLPGVTGTVGYKPAGSDTWQTITTQCASATDHSNISSDECYFTEGGNTVIWTYHFTTFGGFDPVQSRPGGSSHRATPAVPAVPGVSPAVPAIPSINSNNNVQGQVLGAETFNFSRDLNSGAQGDDVTELQNRLTAEGVYKGPITGYFGSLTLAGVKAFQIKFGVSATGYVGPLTLAKLNSAGAVLGAQTTNNTAVSAQVTAIKSQIAILIQQLIQMLQDQAKTQQN